MDNNPLTYIMTMPNLDEVGHRWVAEMAGYNFEIEYMYRGRTTRLPTPSVEWASA